MRRATNRGVLLLATLVFKIGKQKLPFLPPPLSYDYVIYGWYLSQVIVKSAPVSARNALHISFGSELFALSLVSFGGLG